MKPFLFLLLSAMLIGTSGFCQDFKFGKISEQELTMESYDKDPDANAVILYEENYLQYALSAQGARDSRYWMRIKILKTEGIDQADISFTYINHTALRESISGIDAAAYNLENGKIVKTSLKKQYIFNERIDEHHMCIKFSIPEVRVGTVIEYRFCHSSPNLTYIPPFVVQHDIPVVCSHMQAEIPEFFKMRIDQKGYIPLNIKEDAGSASLPLNAGNQCPYTTRIIKVDGSNIPALKSESYIWSLSDFRSMVRFELSQIAFPFAPVRNFAGTWKSVNDALFQSSFNTCCRIGNPYKDQVKAIVAAQGDARAKAHEVLKLVQSKMKWNKEYRLFSTNPRAAATKGTGSSAEMNFILMAALKDAGLNVAPILLRPRHMGRLPYTYASFDYIITFVVRIDLGNEQYVYADATDPNSDLNVLPQELLVDRARIYGVNGEDGWCDLSQLTKNNMTARMLLTISPDGTITGTVIETYTNQAAFNISTKYTLAQSEEKYIDDIEKEQNIQIENLKIDGIGTLQVTQKYTLTTTSNCSDEYIYLNATILPFMTTNTFNTSSRILPIEFANAQNYEIRGLLTLPEKYIVEECPPTIGLVSEDKTLTCRYTSQTTLNNLQFLFTFSQQRLIYLPTEFDQLNSFFGLVANQNNSQIVIRKNS